MRLEGGAVERMERQVRVLEIRRKESHRVFEQHKRTRIADGQKVLEAQEKFKYSLNQARKALSLKGNEGRVQISQKLQRGRELLDESEALKKKLRVENRTFQVVKSREQAAEQRMRILSRKLEFVEAAVHEGKVKKALMRVSREDEEVLEILSGRENDRAFVAKLARNEDDRIVDTSDGPEAWRDSQELATPDRVEHQQEQFDVTADEQNQPSALPFAVHEDGRSGAQQGTVDIQMPVETPAEQCASFEEMCSRLKGMDWSSTSENSSVSFYYGGDGEDGVRVFVEHHARTGIQISLTADAGFSATRLSKVLHLIRSQMRENNLPLSNLIVNKRVLTGAL
jgi:hypothetical protein